MREGRMIVGGIEARPYEFPWTVSVDDGLIKLNLVTITYATTSHISHAIAK